MIPGIKRGPMPKLSYWRRPLKTTQLNADQGIVLQNTKFFESAFYWKLRCLGAFSRNWRIKDSSMKRYLEGPRVCVEYRIIRKFPA